jgi:hypothetical protein
MLVTWHPRLPARPEGFLNSVSFSLTREEADFLIDRIVTTHQDSLLAHLALRCAPAEVRFPWQHPDLASFTPMHRELLDHARRFSEVMHGAALLYNLALVELAQRTELVEEHRVSLRTWARELDRADLRRWSLPRLWELTQDQGRTLTPATVSFIRAWVELALTQSEALVEDPSARVLIEQREQRLKGGPLALPQCARAGPVERSRRDGAAELSLADRTVVPERSARRAGGTLRC